MLADPKTKPSWVLNPRASGWSRDQNKLGQKMMEKMGWSAGKGLGAREQGQVEAIRITYKGDTRGFGTSRKKEQEDWLKQQESFQSLLEQLNGSDDKIVKVNSLEEKSRTTRTKIHYHKFARGKDISRYSEKDLSCIVGSGFVPVKIPETDSGTLPSTSDGIGTSSVTGDHSTSLESDTEEGSMDHSRRGRLLKATPKAAAISEQKKPSPPRKKKIRNEPAETPNGDSSELKRTAKTPANWEQNLPSPKKKKTKGKSAVNNPSSEQCSESAEDDKHERSRSGREYKPSAKAIENSMDRSPPPKKNKSTEESNKTDKNSEHTTAINRKGRSPSPKKKRKEDAEGSSRKTKRDISSKPSSSKESAVNEVDHTHSRSGREYKPSAKATSSLEHKIRSPSKNKMKASKEPDTAVKVGKINPELVEDSSASTSKKSKKRKGTALDVEPPTQAKSSPKKKSKTADKHYSNEDSGVEMDIGSTRKSPRKPPPSNESLSKITQEGSAESEEVGSPAAKKRSKKGKKKEDALVSVDAPSTSNSVTTEKTKGKVRGVSPAQEVSPTKKRQRTRRENFVEPEVVAESAIPKKKKKNKKETIVHELDMNPKSPDARSSKRRNQEVVDDQKIEPAVTKSKRELKKKGLDVEAEDPVEGIDDARTHAGPKIKAKKTKMTEKTAEADENQDIESPVKKRKKKKNVDADTEGVGENPDPYNAAKSEDKRATKTDRKESSESQETVFSKRTEESEDPAEELASINSQSSIILEMIDKNLPEDLEPGEEPEELKKYHILASDSGSTD